jgi:hypothetical protein
MDVFGNPKTGAAAEITDELQTEITQDAVDAVLPIISATYLPLVGGTLTGDLCMTALSSIKTNTLKAPILNDPVNVSGTGGLSADQISTTTTNTVNLNPQVGTEIIVGGDLKLGAFGAVLTNTLTAPILNDPVNVSGTGGLSADQISTTTTNTVNLNPQVGTEIDVGGDLDMQTNNLLNVSNINGVVPPAGETLRTDGSNNMTGTLTTNGNLTSSTADIDCSDKNILTTGDIRLSGFGQVEVTGPTGNKGEMIQDGSIGSFNTLENSSSTLQPFGQVEQTRNAAPSGSAYIEHNIKRRRVGNVTNGEIIFRKYTEGFDTQNPIVPSLLTESIVADGNWGVGATPLKQHFVFNDQGSTKIPFSMHSSGEVRFDEVKLLTAIPAILVGDDIDMQNNDLQNVALLNGVAPPGGETLRTDGSNQMTGGLTTNGTITSSTAHVDFNDKNIRTTTGAITSGTGQPSTISLRPAGDIEQTLTTSANLPIDRLAKKTKSVAAVFDETMSRTFHRMHDLLNPVTPGQVIENIRADGLWSAGNTPTVRYIEHDDQGTIKVPFSSHSSGEFRMNEFATLREAVLKQSLTTPLAQGREFDFGYLETKWTDTPAPDGVFPPSGWGAPWTATASSADLSADRAFNGNLLYNNGWTTDNIGDHAYTFSSGIYDGIITTATTGSGTLAGEWLQMRALGMPMTAKRYRIYVVTSNPDNMPMEWHLLGSTDGTTWTSVDYQNFGGVNILNHVPGGAPGWMDFEIPTINRFTGATYHRLVVLRVGFQPSNLRCYVQEMQLIDDAECSGGVSCVHADSDMQIDHSATIDHNLDVKGTAVLSNVMAGNIQSNAYYLNFGNGIDINLYRAFQELSINPPAAPATYYTMVNTTAGEYRGQLSVPSNTIRPGTLFKMKASGIFSTNDQNDEMGLRVLVGGVGITLTYTGTSIKTAESGFSVEVNAVVTGFDVSGNILIDASGTFQAASATPGILGFQDIFGTAVSPTGVWDMDVKFQTVTSRFITVRSMELIVNY